MNSSESAKVRLRNLVERKQLHEEMGASAEVKGLLESARSYLEDAKREANSQTTRFNVACEAAHALALAAMRACDLRPANGPGHRAIVINTLDSTTTAKPDLIVPLSKAHEKRNKLAYDGLTTFTRTELMELIKSVEGLQSLVNELIVKARPDLIR